MVILDQTDTTVDDRSVTKVDPFEFTSTKTIALIPLVLGCIGRNVCDELAFLK